MTSHWSHLWWFIGDKSFDGLMCFIMNVQISSNTLKHQPCTLYYISVVLFIIYQWSSFNKCHWFCLIQINGPMYYMWVVLFLICHWSSYYMSVVLFNISQWSYVWYVSGPLYYMSVILLLYVSGPLYYTSVVSFLYVSGLLIICVLSSFLLFIRCAKLWF